MYRPMRTTRNLSNLQGRPGWYRIQNRRELGDPEVTQVTIYDEIGMLGVSADTFLRDLAGVTGDIEMHINSPGGDVFDGIAIYNQLRHRQGEVAVIVDGLAASAASFIAQAASPGLLGMSPHSQMMIHDGFGLAVGNAGDMRQMADLLDKASDNIAGIYADRTGRDAGYWRDKMRAETWLSDSEAVAEGLADYVVGSGGSPRQWNLSVYDKATPPPVKKKKPKNKDYSADERKASAAKGHAMPDGSFPIEDQEDLHNAIHLAGNASDPPAARRHIIKRANADGPQHNPDAIPDNWNDDGSLGSADNLSAVDIWAMFTQNDPAPAGKE